MLKKIFSRNTKLDWVAMNLLTTLSSHSWGAASSHQIDRCKLIDATKRTSRVLGSEFGNIDGRKLSATLFLGWSTASKWTILVQIVFLYVCMHGVTFSKIFITSFLTKSSKFQIFANIKLILVPFGISFVKCHYVFEQECFWSNFTKYIEILMDLFELATSPCLIEIEVSQLANLQKFSNFH